MYWALGAALRRPADGAGGTLEVPAWPMGIPLRMEPKVEPPSKLCIRAGAMPSPSDRLYISDTACPRAAAWDLMLAAADATGSSL